MGRYSLLSLSLFTTGQGRLFVSNDISIDTYCQRAYGITPTTRGQQFTYNPNQWGITDDYTGTGALCMNVTSWDNSTYPTTDAAPPFSVTWQFPPAPATQPVYAFPNVKIDSTDFPLAISNVGSIPVLVNWHYGNGDEAPNTTDVASLEANLLNSNLAIDMFVDADSKNATSSVDAEYEVMVWLGAFGPATQPIGLTVGAIATAQVNGTNFNLYYGVNGLLQKVFTWVAAQNIYEFQGDISPLLSNVAALNRGIASSYYLGYMGLGSEVLSATRNVTLSVSELRMSVHAK